MSVMADILSVRVEFYILARTLLLYSRATHRKIVAQLKNELLIRK